MERCFGTLKDRLVNALRLAGIGSLEEANLYLEETFLPDWNQRFARQPAQSVDAHRPLGRQQDLASILAKVEMRKVGNDYTVPWNGIKWQIPKSAIGAGLRGRSIRIEQRLDGAMLAQIGGQPVALSVCEDLTSAPKPKLPRRPARQFIPPPGQSRWMDGFRVEGNPAWKRYRGQPAAAGAVSVRMRNSWIASTGVRST
ncbi:MAG TPA: hypothetical protein VF767_05920 [Bryobacteraceae bacterium]